MPRKIWSLIKLNILYLFSILPLFVATWFLSGLISIPIVEALDLDKLGIDAAGTDIVLRITLSYLFTVFLGQGPLTAGFTYIIREYAEEQHVWLFSDFFKRSIKNFKQSFVLWVVDLLCCYLFVVAFTFYGQLGNWFFQGGLLWVGAIYLVMHIYMYQMIVSFELSLEKILRMLLF